MGVNVDVSCDCDKCGSEVYPDYAIILCEKCYEKVREEIYPGYHLIANGELYCHREKSAISINDADDRIVFCPFCADRLVK